MDFLLLLKIGFGLLPAGATMLVASKTVRQGGNVSFPVLLRDGLILFAVGGIAIFAGSTRQWLDSSNSGFDLVYGAGEVFLMLGTIEILRFLVFGKPKGARRLSKAGLIVSICGALCVFSWIIGSQFFGL